MADTFKYKTFVTDTPNGQREVRFHRLDQSSPMLNALYGTVEQLKDYENGKEVSIDPADHAKVFEKMRDAVSIKQSVAQVQSLKKQGLGVAPEGSDGVATNETASTTTAKQTGSLTNSEGQPPPKE